MIRRQWHDAHAVQPTYYGLGIISGQVGGWDWFGHSGGFQGCLTRTFALPGKDVAVSILTNAADGMSGPWCDGAIHILRTFKEGGGARARTRGLDRTMVEPLGRRRSRALRGSRPHRGA